MEAASRVDSPVPVLSDPRSLEEEVFVLNPVSDRAESSLIRLWPHQEETVVAATRTFGTSARTTAVMACGLGKTRVGCEVAHEIARHGRILIVAPTIDLVGQTLHAWENHRGGTELGRVVAVCSDDDALVDHDGRHLNVNQTLVTTDPQQVAEFTVRAGRVTVASTYQSLPVLATAHAEAGLPPWDLVIVDEAHRAAGRADKAWAMVHDDAVLPAQRRLYLTATPRIVAGGDLTVSMDNEKVFGPICHEVPFSRGIELGLLADYRLIVAVVTDEEMRALAEGQQTHFRVGASGLSGGMLARQIAVLRAAHEHGIRKMITYHHLVDDARWFAATLPRTAAEVLPAHERPVGTVWAGHVHGGQRAGERRAVLERLRTGTDGLTVVANARVLTEGIDVPAVDGVAFLNPRDSVIDIIQALGRAMRTGGRRDKVASIIVPVLVKEGTDPHEALLGSPFAPVLRVAQALRATDDALGKRLDAARRNLGASGDMDMNIGKRDEARGELPEWLSVTGIPVPPQFAKAISVRIVRSASSSWEENIAACALYRQEHGHLTPPQGWSTPRGLPLYNWLEHQKIRYRDGVITEQEIAELEAHGMVWNRLDALWEQFVADLKEFRDEYGHLDVPQHYVNAHGRRLGTQVQTRRMTFDELSAERSAELLNLGFVPRVLDHRWHRYFNAWLAYKQQHGDPIVPRGYVTDDGLKLGQWRISQLKRYRAGTMPAERARLVAQHRMHHNGPEVHRQRHLEALRDFRNRHGHVRVPYNHVTDTGLKLGEWLITQRGNLRKGNLKPEQAKELAELGVRTTRGGT
ncbi:helicase [Streptomyces botrytidirepellens]|uniref:Helicase n=2 Tax=Streptomyces botrytidirepellens TaxID=2486417 RepID=A0A3M8X954_9ACTN|nr:helicase [Streptomyces botrytidirepellens]